MSLPIAALGALIAALLETSVLTELSFSGIKPDLVFVLAVVVALVVGFEDALVWAVVGGLDAGRTRCRPMGSTTLALLVVVGMAALLGRVLGTPRADRRRRRRLPPRVGLPVVMLAILAVTAGVGIGELPMQRWLAIAILDAVVAVLAVVLIRASVRRFAPPAERLEW